MKLLRILAVSLLFIPGLLSAQAPTPRTAAIIVSNRAGADYDEKIPVLEDLVSSRVADLGLRVISRETVLNSLRTFDPETASLPRPSSSLETAFTDQSSATRLAQGLGADYVLHISLTGYGTNDRQTRAYGTEINATDYTLYLTYKILDATQGAALTGDTVKSTRSVAASTSSRSNDSGLLLGLMDDASQKVAAGLKTRLAANPLPAPAAAAALATVNLKVEAADLYIPDVRVSTDNTVIVGQNQLKVTPLSVTVEVDGVAVGTAPGSIQVKKGFSKIRLTRDGFEPWERVINAVDGQTLTVALSMTDKARAELKELTAFLNDQRNGAKLSDAEIKRLEGEAEKLKNSKYSVDVKVDTDENFKFILPGTYTEK